MNSILRYRIASDAYTTVRLTPPLGSSITELATLDDGHTYVSIPEGSTIPEQPASIASSIEYPYIPSFDELTAIRAKSPSCALISSQVRDMIAERYSTSDEIKLLRLGPSEDFTTYNNYVESCRAWGKQQRAALGI